MSVPNVVGVWRLVGGATTDPSGRRVAVPYGPRGMGLIVNSRLPVQLRDLATATVACILRKPD